MWTAMSAVCFSAQQRVSEVRNEMKEFKEKNVMKRVGLQTDFRNQKE